mmetsp:Transcript_12828/g.39467  ORF Transcript_12828/g.39467 Transcript_12828/m.39467 type:complete len:124 (-) Transcript_12828:1118-1489(-)
MDVADEKQHFQLIFNRIRADDNCLCALKERKQQGPPGLLAVRISHGHEWQGQALRADPKSVHSSWYIGCSFGLADRKLVNLRMLLLKTQVEHITSTSLQSGLYFAASFKRWPLCHTYCAHTYA